MSNKKVVVVQDTGHDYSEAEKYGEVTHYALGPINVFSEVKLNQARKWVRENLNKEDSILVCGNTVLNAVIIHEALEKNGEVLLLIYHNKELKYKPIRLEK